jgi:hypothetical protein
MEKTISYRQRMLNQIVRKPKPVIEPVKTVDNSYKLMNKKDLAEFAYKQGIELDITVTKAVMLDTYEKALNK